MKTVLRIMGAALLAAASLARAEQPSATFVSFNDWLASDFKGVRIDADGRLLFGVTGA